MFLAIILVLTCLPSVVNVYNFSGIEWWKQPSMSCEYQKILPTYFGGLYSVPYYFLGAYLKEKKITIRISKLCISLMGVIFATGIYQYYRSYGTSYVSGPWMEYGSFFTVIISVLIFLIFQQLNTLDWNITLKQIIKVTSDACLGAYLLSYIFDDYFYKFFNFTKFSINVKYIYIVGIVFICSLLASMTLNGIISLYKVAMKSIRNNNCEKG